jgi:hypothetical protein
MSSYFKASDVIEITEKNCNGAKMAKNRANINTVDVKRLFDLIIDKYGLSLKVIRTDKGQSWVDIEMANNW